MHAVGQAAKLMIGRTPEGIEIVKPLRDGVIADLEATEHMIRAFVHKAQAGRSLFGPNIVICVPSGSTQVERRAICEAAESAGARQVRLIDEPMAAAIGANLPVTEATGSMVVDIGGGTTEVAVISLAGIAYWTSVRVGGTTMDEAIISFVRREYDLLIGERTAERAKIEIGTALPPEQGRGLSTKISGLDLHNRIPRKVEMDQKHMADALHEPVGQIIDAVQKTLENTAPELASDIINSGIVLVGGGAILTNLDRAIGEAAGLKVVVANTPLLCVALGTGRAMEDSALEGVLIHN